MLYDRKIKYLDYYEGGSKVNGGGFAKLEIRGNILRLELTVRGLYPTDSFERDIVLQGKEKEETLGQIRIQNGSGQFCYSCDANQGIGAAGISYSELRGIRISIGGTREILCQWDDVSNRRRITPQKENAQIRESKQTEKREEKRIEAEKEECENIESKHKEGINIEGKDRERQEDNGNTEDKGNTKNKENAEDKEYIDDKKKNNENEESKESSIKGVGIKGDKINLYAYAEPIEMQAQESAMVSDVMSPQFSKEPLQGILQSEKQPGDQFKDEAATVENTHAEQSDVMKEPVKLMEDKWQQLSAIYPHIQPFRDERDYLSLTPSDFVLFPNRFYRAVNNSFLLHGYYNYHHLILARIERRGETLYYIGVPGNYFEREKQVAIMFGFESFECETEPAKTGDFGYYMMRTEL